MKASDYVHRYNVKYLGYDTYLLRDVHPEKIEAETGAKFCGPDLVHDGIRYHAHYMGVTAWSCDTEKVKKAETY